MRYSVWLELDGLYLRTLGLKDQAAVVHRDGRVIDVTASAEKRLVVRGSSLQEAKLLLQDQAVYVKFNEEDYKQAAEQWLELLLKYTGTVQPVTPASAFVDLSLHPQPDEIVTSLLHELHRKEKLPITAGVGPSRWLAQLSARECDTEPLGLGIMPIEPVLHAKEWLAPLRASCLLPLPAETRLRLEQLGIQYVREVQEMPFGVLVQQFRKEASLIRSVAEGRLHDPVQPAWPPKSFSSAVNLDRCESSVELDAALRRLAVKAATRLCAEDRVAGGLKLFLLTESNKVLQSDRVFKRPVQAVSELHTHLRLLVEKLAIEEPIQQARLLLSDLVKSSRRQMAMPLVNASDQGAMPTVLKRLQNAHGKNAIIQASQIEHTREQKVLKAWREAYGWR